jgi:hypothetical protein
VIVYVYGLWLNGWESIFLRRRIYRLLWVAVPLLAAVAFPILRPYIAVVTTVFMVDLLWRCWVTRKVGP